MKRVGTVVHTGRAGAAEAAEKVSAYLQERGIEVLPATRDDGADLLIAFGGDGTLLRAAQIAGPGGPPILGVNHGRLGFLTGLERAQLDAALPAIASGDLHLEDRTLLQVEVGDETIGFALNDAVVEKSRAGRAILVHLRVGGEDLVSWSADAVIVATSTGSTAYAFSAGGPVVSPRLDLLVVTPVAPHGPFGRTLVVPPDEVVEIRVEDEAALALDGAAITTLEAGSAVRVGRAAAGIRLARPAADGFWGLVRDKFGLRGGGA